MELDVEIPTRWVLFVYLTLELLKFVYERFINQQEYLRILRDIAASQHATALILEKIAQGLNITNDDEMKKTRKPKVGAILNVSGSSSGAGAAQSGRTRKKTRFNIGSAFARRGHK